MDVEQNARDSIQKAIFASLDLTSDLVDARTAHEKRQGGSFIEDILNHARICAEEAISCIDKLKGR